MKKETTCFITITLVLVGIFVLGTALAQTIDRPVSTRSLAHLYELMAKEPPLAEIDLSTYIKHLPSIVWLDFNPSGQEEVLRLTGWSERRLVYAATKIGVSLFEILEPEALERNFPEFARPTETEKELVQTHFSELLKAYRQLISPKSDENRKKNKS